MVQTDINSFVLARDVGQNRLDLWWHLEQV